MNRIGLAAVVIGLVLRALSASHHEVPRGDVVLDVGVARSLSQGEGFRSGFERGVPVVVGADTAVPPQGWADQHPPLWPLVGAAFSVVTGDAFSGLRLASWLSGLVLLLLVWRCGERLTEGLSGAPAGLGACAAGVVALSFVMVDAGGNGSLYSAQAALVLALIEAVAAPRRSVLRMGLSAGLLLGAAALLNHQALVLLPVPLVARLACARRGELGQAWAVGLMAMVVAALCLAPWWMRNFALFGQPNHSVNNAYLLYKAGMPPSFLIEQGGPVIRLVGELSLLDLARAMVGFLRGNIVYLASTGLWALPCLGGLLLAGLPGLLLTARRRHDLRLTTLLVCLVVLGAVTLLWPAAKLRYLVTLTPLLALLGVRVAASLTTVWQRRWGVVVVLGWLVLLAGTADDLMGTASDPRPARWWGLAVGGALLVVLPLLWRLWSRGRLSARALVWVSGMPVALLGTGVMLGSSPGTAYHSTVFAHDAFGHHVERERAATWNALRAARDLLHELDAQTVLGPVELLAWAEPALIELPRGTGPAILKPALTSLLERGVGDHLVLSLAEARSIASAELIPGARWFDGRLEVTAIVSGSGEGLDGPAALAATTDAAAIQCVSRILLR